MTIKPILYMLRRLWPLFLITGGLLPGYAQVPVILGPLPKLQLFDANGRTLANGCVFTYVSGTTTPLATYTDSSGTTLNPNPVVLDSGGYAGIWLKAGQSYTIKVKSFGGVNCASGSQLYSVDGIGGGTTQAVVVVPYSPTPTFVITSQNTLFEITLTGNASAQPLTAVGIVAPGLVTFQITQDNVGGHTFSWPANSIGGAPICTTANCVTTQHFIWNGVNATAVGPAITGNGPAISEGPTNILGNLSVTGNIAATGTLNIGGTALFGGAITAPGFYSSTANSASAGLVRLAQADILNWRNAANSGDEGLSTDGSDRLNVSHPNGVVLTGGNPFIRLGGTSNAFPMWKRNGTQIQARLADDSDDADITGKTGLFAGHITFDGVTFDATAAVAGESMIATSPTGAAWGLAGSTLQTPSITILGGNVNVSGTTTIMTKSVTMPAQGCPCRAFVSYGIFITASTHGLTQSWVNDGTSNMATSETDIFNDNSPDGANAATFSPGTYANNASVTFTLKTNNTTASGVVVQQHNDGPVGQDSWMNVAVITSQ